MEEKNKISDSQKQELKGKDNRKKEQKQNKEIIKQYQKQPQSQRNENDHSQSIDLDFDTHETKNHEKVQKQNLINQTKKQKYREDNFTVGAGHAFFISDAQQNYDNQEDKNEEKIGKQIFRNSSEKDSEMTDFEKNNNHDSHDHDENQQDVVINPALDQSYDHGRLSLVHKDQKYKKILAWAILVFSVILGASIPTWILHYPAKKYLRICWRFFMVSFWLIPLMCWEYQQPKYKNLYVKSNIFNLRNLRKTFLSALGSSLWFGFILFSFDYTSVSHAILLGNMQNFFLSIWRIYFKKQKSMEIEIVGQVLISVGIVLIFTDSWTMNDLQNVNREKFILTDYLDRSIWERIVFGDVICMCVSMMMCKFSLIETEVKNIFPPYLSLFLTTINSAFLMVFISWVVEITNISQEGVTGWFDLFQWDNLISYIILSFFNGLGLFLSYMYIGKYFQPIVSASIFLYEPIIATMLIFIFSVEMLPGPFACLGYVFMIPGMFLILMTRHILSIKAKK